jgi:hypothetical protein
MRFTRWFVIGLLVPSLHACGILETKPSDSTPRSDSTNIDKCSYPGGGHTTRAEGALPSTGACTMTGSGFP